MDLIRPTLSYLRSNPLLIAIIAFSSAALLMITVFDGFVGCRADQCGYIIGHNFKDKLQHLSVSSVAFQTWPFNSTLFAGQPLQGYHYAPNLVAYLLSLIGIPVSFSFLQLMPLAYTVIFPFLAIPIARRLHDSPVFVALFLTFAYLGTTFTLYQTFFYTGDWFEKEAVLVPLMENTQVMRSLHYGLSLLLMMAIVLLYHRHPSRPVSIKTRLIVAGLLFLLVGTKFYGAVLASIGIGVAELMIVWQQWKKASTRKKHLLQSAGALAGYSLVGIVAILVFYNPLAGTSAGSPFAFAPFAIVHHMIEDRALFYDEEMLLARYFLEENGGFTSPRYWYIQLYSALLFFCYYLGTRILGVGMFLWKGIRRQLSGLEIMVASMVIPGMILPLVIIQNGDWFNTIQFLAYATFFLSVFSAQAVYQMFSVKKKPWRPVLIATAAIILLVTVLPNLKRFTYFWSEDQYVVAQEELPALSALREQPFGTVFVTPLKPEGAYHTALGQKIAYYYEAYENVYRNWGIPYLERKDLIDSGAYTAVEADYFYLYKDDEKVAQRMIETFETNDRYEIIFEDDTVILYRSQNAGE